MVNHISFIHFCSFKAFLGRLSLRTYPYYISLHLHAIAGTDLASTIGSWAAVLLALMALFGVIGPYHIWRTLHSARYVAISGIDDPSRRFVSKGVPIWRSSGQAVRVRKKIRVSDLTGSPAFKSVDGSGNGGVLARMDDAMREPVGRTGWAMFVMALDAYSGPYGGGRGEAMGWWCTGRRRGCP
jgi:hypothetical protein